MPIDGPGELTVRVAAKGGFVASTVRAIHGDPAGKRRLVIFVHGFANDHKKASGSYQNMTDLLRNQNVSSTQLGDLWWFYWPGDLLVWGLSQASYPIQIGHAKESAERLADYLVELCDRAGGPIEVLFVAHSLGNRVVLETIAALEKKGRPKESLPLVSYLVLMAAAVPDSYCEPSGLLPKGAAARSELNLYSRKDKVLRFAFPPGQTAAGEGWFPTAVGRSGNPSARWSASLVTPFGHSDYWKGEYSSKQVTRVFRAAPPRVTPERELIVDTGAPERPIESRSIAGAGPDDRVGKNMLGIYPA
jgi:pimeloyl-ACP methyl ester carboxylesterase